VLILIFLGLSVLELGRMYATGRQTSDIGQTSEDKKKHRLMPPHNKLFGMPTQHPCKLTFDFLTLKVVSESRVTWATSVPYFSLPRPLCSRLRSDARDRQTDVRRASSLYAHYPRDGAITR